MIMILHDGLEFADIILMVFENVFHEYKNPPSGIKQWHKRDTAGP